MTAGQPAYAPGLLLKLYLWGYLNRTRSSRRREQETYRNLEVIWLLQGLHPYYKTLADFRKEHPQALKAVYTDFLLGCREWQLFGGELVGIDRMFWEGNASKRSISTRKWLEKWLARIDAEITAYLQALKEGDEQERRAFSEDDALGEKLAHLQARRADGQAMLDRLTASGETPVSRTDAEARFVSKKTEKGPTAGDNVQWAVDSKHNLIVAGDVVNDGNDSRQLAPMATQAKARLG